jgi:hypothetical protein
MFYINVLQKMKYTTNYTIANFIAYSCAFAFFLNLFVTISHNILVMYFPYIGRKVSNDGSEQCSRDAVINKSIITSETYRRQKEYQDYDFHGVFFNHKILKRSFKFQLIFSHIKLWFHKKKV